MQAFEDVLDFTCYSGMGNLILQLAFKFWQFSSFKRLQKRTKRDPNSVKMAIFSERITKSAQKLLEASRIDPVYNALELN